MKRPEQYAARRADPALQEFVDDLRGALDLKPLYSNPKQTDLDRFYIPPPDPVPRPKRIEVGF